jgi:hypothetical protein
MMTDLVRQLGQSGQALSKLHLLGQWHLSRRLRLSDLSRLLHQQCLVHLLGQ